MNPTGQIPKLVQKVRHITFSGPEAIKRGQEVLYVTERAIFKLTEDGVELVAVVSGVDLEQDILQRMQFCPKVDRPAIVSL
ncbi:Acyl CoA:acetate/3-ketoacid CoA transferase [Raoultella terrigena]|uniref:Acyl CoA:acetate/3-ketoacid CoA transferase n=1 Tax=Raoultella terrigena TaxID=577 RepID=A0A485CA88_RAOTE|nr:Acyl CoA:acetate/3-ketoacid CoA transferase [Raoultella terrigena]